MAVPDRLLQLVDTFGRNLNVYKSGGYNETQVRVEFIDPLFDLLGWDRMYGLTGLEVRVVEEATP
ncbi:MAG: hypothetical protein MUF10_12995 [Thermoanaerobaculaceae bacterium]|jgi:hypothetical protein|nr:hypothetical protein [Thermoanaerobaculaceae bacterium]